ncbi:MAG: Lrp/AsnC family transcriptional regulator [Promethearchaeota archaeon]
MDKVDIKLLAAMEQNARVSLKNLARDLDVKTSTIYHRLHKLRESNILERFTIEVNPELIGLHVHSLIAVRVKKMVIGKLDAMFLESFAKFLSEHYIEVLFSSVGSDEQIHLIASFRDDGHYENFLADIKANPYIEDFNCILFDKILKGKKLFTFNEALMNTEDDGNYFDDSEKSTELPEAEEDETSEVFF